MRGAPCALVKSFRFESNMQARLRDIPRSNDLPHLEGGYPRRAYQDSPLIPPLRTGRPLKLKRI